MPTNMVIGEGTSVFASPTVSGVARWFNGPADVLLVDWEVLAETIAFVRLPGVAFLAPILGSLRGVVCCTGSPDSHLALIALQYGLPCIMGATLHVDVNDGTAVRLQLRADRKAKITAGADGPAPPPDAT